MIQKSPNDIQQNSPKQRELRIGELLRHVLSDILTRGDLRDPDLAGHSINISEVRVTPDLRAATAYVSLFGGGDLRRVVSGLNRAAPYLNGRVARAVQLRNSPKFNFQADPSFEKASRIEALLRQPRIRRDLAGVKTSDKQ